MKGRVTRWSVGLLVAIAVGVCGCGGTPGSGAGSSAQSVGKVQKSGFGKLGPVKLTIWSYDNQDPGLEPVLKTLTSNFEKKYPNVSINLVFKDFNSLVNVVPRALASGQGPDVTEGNQGFQTDAQLVKAKLILPLEPYIKAYGWDKWYSPSTWSMFRWTPDGRTFGKGPIWGVAQTGQNVGVFVNTQKLRQLGFDPNSMPTTFDEFDKMLAQIRAKLPANEPVIEFGNKEGYGTIHMFGGIQAAFVPPQVQRDWIFHAKGSSWDSPATIKALGTYQSWAKNGYFNDDYNAIGYDQAAAEFAKGNGVFLINGDWDATIVQQGLGSNVTMINIPPGPSGQHAGIGATSGPWHISSKTKYPDVGAAWLNYVISSPEAVKLMYAQKQIPAIAGVKAPASDPFLGAVTDAWQQLVQDNGLMLYTDWASPSMYQTLASNFQLLLAGKTSPEDMARAVQSDWEKFDATLH